jgi:hypothetical protein
MSLRPIIVATAALILSAATASAELPRDWYVAHKRLAKDVRVAAHQREQNTLTASMIENERHTRRISGWSPKPPSAEAAPACEATTLYLHKAIMAAKRGTLDGAEAFQFEMANWDRMSDRCWSAIVGR